MDLSKENSKKLLLLACGVVLFYCCLQNLGEVAKWLEMILGLVMPFLVGCAIAFIINVPMKGIEKRLAGIRVKFIQKYRRVLAFFVTVLLIIAVLALSMLAIIPELADSLRMLFGQIPEAFDRMMKSLDQIAVAYPQLEESLSNVQIDWQDLLTKVSTILKNGTEGILNSGFGMISGIINSVASFFIGMVFAIYILFQKEKLSRQAKQVLYALCPEKAADKTMHIAGVANRTFSNFLAGQCLEAVILGTMFFVTLSIFRMPYAVLIGVTIALTALIPIVGAFIGCFIGALMILIVNPFQALIFVVIFLVLQQIEGNLIYPRVVGGSVGLPSIWVLAAVTIGGNLMGIVGMIIFIPLCSVMYSLFREYIKECLKEKKVPKEKYTDQRSA